MAIDQFPKPEDEEFRASDAETEDDEEDEESPKEKRTSFLDYFLRRNKKESSDNSEIDEDKLTLWQKIGASLGINVEKARDADAESQPDQTTTVEAPPAMTEVVEQPLEAQPDLSQVETEAKTESADDIEPTPVFSRQADGELIVHHDSEELSDDSLSAPDSTASDGYEHAESEPEPTVAAAETSDADSADIEVEPVAPDIEPTIPDASEDEPDEPSISPPPIGTPTPPERGFRGSVDATPTSEAEPAEIHHHHVERYPSGALAGDILVYAAASHKIKEKGKAIERLRHKAESTDTKLDFMTEEARKKEAASNERFEKLERKVRQQAENTSKAVPDRHESPKAPKGEREAAKPVDTLLQKFESSGAAPVAAAVAAVETVRAKQERQGQKDVDKPVERYSRSEAREAFEAEEPAWIERIQESEKKDESSYTKGVEQDIEQEDDTKEGPQELKYERSHETKQFTPTALASLLDTSEVKKRIEMAQASRIKTHDELIAESRVYDPPREIISPEEVRNTNQKAIVTGFVTALVLMAAYFVMKYWN